MVRLEKRAVGGKTCYYFSHTYRLGGKVRYKETYIGENVPKNLDKIRNEFLHEIYKEKWFGQLNIIKRAYSKEQRKTPASAREKNLEAFAIRFTYDTNRIEGSKLTLFETAALLEHGISPKNKPIRYVKEAESHQKVFYEMLDYKSDLSLGTVLKWHKDLFSETKPDMAGKIRPYMVYITNSAFIPPPPNELPSRLSTLFQWYSEVKSELNPVEMAGLLHLKFETIHPFGDGNGRVGRLLMNFVLHKNGYPMFDIRYEDRRGYYRALERVQTKGEDGIFLQWFFKKYIKDNKGYL
ncbi:MAG: Fic family protein [Rhabdochlamydiaceae bacterium]